MPGKQENITYYAMTIYFVGGQWRKYQLKQSFAIRILGVALRLCLLLIFFIFDKIDKLPDDM